MGQAQATQAQQPPAQQPPPQQEEPALSPGPAVSMPVGFMPNLVSSTPVHGDPQSRSPPQVRAVGPHFQVAIGST
eukprot:7074502-Lingulodinium_polyedra.AAC.1